METHLIPGARFVDPDVLARDRTSSCSRARSSTASSTACTARRTSARRSTSPSTAATCRATTSGASTGGCTRGPTATTSSSTKPTPTRTSRSCSTSRSRWAFASRGRLEARVRDVPGGLPRVPGAPAARPRRHHHVRRGHRRRTCRPRPSTSTCCCTRSIARRPERPGRLLRDAAAAGRALQAPQHPGADLGLLRGPGRHPRRDQAVPLPAATTSSCSTCSTRPRSTFPTTTPSRFDGSRERRGAAGRARVVRRAVPGADAGAHRGARGRSSPSAASTTSLLNTSKPLDEALFSYLGNRERLMRVR